MNRRQIFGTVDKRFLPWAAPVSAPVPAPMLIACPIPAAMYGTNLAQLQQVYRLAYEAALLVARPSRYERAIAVCSN